VANLLAPRQKLGPCGSLGRTSECVHARLTEPRTIIANSNDTVQTRALHTYLRRRNANANARHPDILAAQRKERARTLSEKGLRWGGRPLTTSA
jgi:hypothetical protein